MQVDFSSNAVKKFSLYLTKYLEVVLKSEIGNPMRFYGGYKAAPECSRVLQPCV